MVTLKERMQKLVDDILDAAASDHHGDIEPHNAVLTITLEIPERELVVSAKGNIQSYRFTYLNEAEAA